jgi:hypothetical protein
MNHKTKSISFVLFACIMAFVLCAPVHAEDQIFQGKAERVTMKATKAGETYAIVFVKEGRVLEGVSYSVDVPMYAFGTAGEKAKTLKPGDEFKAVVNKSERGGNTRYNVLAFAM